MDKIDGMLGVSKSPLLRWIKEYEINVIETKEDKKNSLLLQEKTMYSL